VFGRKPISLATVRTLVIGADHPHTLSSSAALIGWQTETLRHCSVLGVAGMGLETWVKVAQGTSPTQLAMTGKAVERGPFWAQRPRSLNRSLQRDRGKEMDVEKVRSSLRWRLKTVLAWCKGLKRAN
jgi:hypothetical protein